MFNDMVIMLDTSAIRITVQQVAVLLIIYQYIFISIKAQMFIKGSCCMSLHVFLLAALSYTPLCTGHLKGL